MAPRFLVVGAGFSGAVLAHQLTKLLPGCQIDVWEEKNHIAGNCYTERDARTGIMVHRYGPHIFNTDRKDVWDFISSFIEMRPFVHKVRATARGEVFSLPVTLLTINQYFRKAFSPAEAKSFIQSQSVTIDSPKNFEEQALKFVGEDLYNTFFKGYTKKQWGCEPKELPASILQRLPLRFNYNDSYYSNPYVGIPVEGYTPFVKTLLDHETITVHLNRRFESHQDLAGYDHVFFTAPLDAFFDYKFGRLGYRTLTFEQFYAKGDYQGTQVMNYCDEDVPFTRITEHKHFTPWESHDDTICFREFSKETEPGDIPYYPKRLSADKEKLALYREEAGKLATASFLGRLGTYRYMDMHHVIGESLDFAENFAKAFSQGDRLPVFPNKEI